MSINYIYPEFEVVRDESKCIHCKVCVRQCANEVHSYDEDLDVVKADESKCWGRKLRTRYPVSS